MHLDHDPSAVGQPLAAPDPALEQRWADAAAHRVMVGERLAVAANVNGGGPGWVSIADGSFAERATATLAALRAGAAYVWNAVLPLDAAGARRGEVDLLVRAELADPAEDSLAGSSISTEDSLAGSSISTGYRPIIVVNHRVTDPGSGALTGPIYPPLGERCAPDESRRARSHTRDQLRLAHLARMLEASGFSVAGAVLGGVIGLDADVVLWHDLTAPSWPDGRSTLAEYDSRFADRLAVARAAAGQQPALAQPSRITECRRCPWWPTCERVLLERRDISLVVRGEDASLLRANGVRTVAELAALDPGDRQAAVLRGMSPLEAVALARAWLRGLPLARKVDTVAVLRADVEVDIDMESFGESGAYLWGALLSGADIGQAPGYRAFATWRPLPTDDEARSFAEFWGWLREVRSRCAARGLSFAAYCYNEQAENRWLLGSADRFAGRPGIPARAEVAEFIESDRWVDLFAVVSRWFLCAHGKGLKRVAPVSGFAWADPEASGENSMRWYRDAVGMDGGLPDSVQRERLLRYNRDDVHATLSLRQWMCSPALNDIPLATEL